LGSREKAEISFPQQEDMHSFKQCLHSYDLITNNSKGNEIAERENLRNTRQIPLSADHKKAQVMAAVTLCQLSAFAFKTSGLGEKSAI